MKALRNAALDYADRGWRVMPLHPRSKAPLGLLVPNGQKDATDDLAMVLRWWTRKPFPWWDRARGEWTTRVGEPMANVGLVAGESGWIALDVDPRNGGDDDLHELERQLGELPETVRAETGGGGEHYLFTHPGGSLRGKLGVPAPGRAAQDYGVDVKDHGYIVAPPSIHPSGGAYAWDLAPEDVQLAELPPAWIEAVRQPAAVQRAEDLAVNVNHDDPLRRIPAAAYVQRLTGRDVVRGGWARCPFHGGGQEAQPSLSCKGTIWACYGCPAPPGKRVAGGNIYDFAAWLWDFPTPLRGPDFLDVKARLRAALEAT